jgi:hypothetical protein
MAGGMISPHPGLRVPPPEAVAVWPAIQTCELLLRRYPGLSAVQTCEDAAQVRAKWAKAAVRSAIFKRCRCVGATTRRVESGSTV